MTHAHLGALFGGAVLFDLVSWLLIFFLVGPLRRRRLRRRWEVMASWPPPRS